MRTLWLRRLVRLVFVLCVITPAWLRAADAPFEKEIEAFERQDKAHFPPRDAVLFVGSSTIRIWTTVQEDFPKVPVINRGFGGSQIADSIRYADRIIIPYHPKQIILYAGDNDLAAGKSPQQVAQDFQTLVEKIRPALPDAAIAFISIKPCPARWKIVDKVNETNRLVEQYAAKQKNVRYIDIVPLMLTPDGQPRKELFRADGLHMNRNGYELWVPVISRFIQ